MKASHEDNISEQEESHSERSSESSSAEEIDSGSTLIEDAASKARAQYEEILQELLMEGHDENEAKQEAFERIPPVFPKEYWVLSLWMTGMDGSVEKRSHPQKNHGDPR